MAVLAAGALRMAGALGVLPLGGALAASAWAWAFAFALFGALYAPILSRPRVDREPNNFPRIKEPSRSSSA